MTDRQRKKTTYSLGIVILALLIGLLGGVMTAPKLDAQYWSDGSEDADEARFATMMQIIESCYVDDVDRDSVTDVMMNAMLQTLDPHSCYLAPDVLAKEAEIMQGQFMGIGVTLFYLGDSVYVSNVMSGGPAARAGLHAGDRIMRVDTTTVSGAGLITDGEEVVSLIRGPQHTSVTLGIQRQGSSKIQNFKIRRDIIQMNSIPAVVMADKTTGYIRISRFAETTGSEFHSALLQLQNEGMKQLVLDLRENGGGSMESAVEVCDELLPKGDLIVYTQGDHDRRRNIHATKGGLFESGKVAVLINENSASASEIVAGAIQDNDRGTIIGHRSFGKGLVQRQFPLPGGAAMLLTIARYHSPSGRCIQRPYDKGSDEYYREYVSRVVQEYVAADSILDAGYDTTQSFTTKKGRKVYGGGGIQPDIRLPYFSDTSLVYYNRLIGNRVFSEAVHEELFAHYDQLIQRYPDIEAFKKGYAVDDAAWRALLQRADRKGIARHPEGIRKYADEMRNRYKAEMAMALYGENAYYQISLSHDTELQKALKSIRN